MRIARVRIKNFRCLEDVTVEFEDVTTLIGPNGVGKSTVLHALDWFFNGSKTGVLVDEDLTYGSGATQIEVQVEFHKLTLEDRNSLGKYASPEVDRCVISKYRRADGQEVMSGNAKSFREFTQIRTVAGKERRDAFNQLVVNQPDLGLAKVTTIAAADEAMRAWETAHPDRLTDAPDTMTNFFGFNSQAVMSGHFDYVLVKADLRAREEAIDSKSTIIGRILERAVDRKQADALLDQLTEEIKIQCQVIYNENFTQKLTNISEQLTDAIGLYTSGAAGRAIKVKLDPPEVKLHSTHFLMSVLDASLETTIERQGHGFQRTLLISSLQVLANRNAANANEGTICLAIEEPELFQHPTQAQSFARVLRSLAETPERRIQVAYATHSPYFIDAERFQQVRRITREASSVPGKTPTVSIASSPTDKVLSAAGLFMSDEQIRRRIDRAWLNHLPEALFASKVILAEAETDKAVIEGYFDRQGEVPLATQDIAVVVARGKAGYFLPYIILDQLGIPCYVIIETDSNHEVRARSRKKSEQDIQAEIRNLAKQNRDNLTLIGEQAVDWPTSVVAPRHAVIEDRLETFLSSWIEWGEARENAVQQGMGDEKTASTYRYATREAGGNPPTFFAEVLDAVKKI